MTKEEKIAFYATARRAYAGTINQIVDGDVVTYWVGKLRGNIVSFEDEYKFITQEEAVECARKFRKMCLRKARQLNLNIVL